MNIRRLFSASLFLFVPGIALAHPGDHSHMDFATGLMHPLLGLDHLLALIAAGIWLAQQPLRNRPLLGSAFVGALALGLAVGRYFPGVQFETGIVATIICLGALVACAAKLPVWASATILGAVASIHGFVHGSEMSPALNLVSSFAIGLIVSSSWIFGVSSVAFSSQSKLMLNNLVTKLTGAAIIVFGLVMAF